MKTSLLPGTLGRDRLPYFPFRYYPYEPKEDSPSKKESTRFERTQTPSVEHLCSVVCTLLFLGSYRLGSLPRSTSGATVGTRQLGCGFEGQRLEEQLLFLFKEKLVVK